MTASFDALADDYKAARARREDLKTEARSCFEAPKTADDALAPRDTEPEGEEWKARFEEATIKLDSAEGELLGHPESLQRVRCWMIDVTGKEPCGEDALSDEMVEEYFKPGNQGRHHEEMDKHGGLAAAVRQVMSKYNLTDSGSGCGRWDMGSKCTVGEAQALMEELHSKFGKAIERGLLQVTRKKWSISII